MIFGISVTKRTVSLRSKGFRASSSRKLEREQKKGMNELSVRRGVRKERLDRTLILSSWKFAFICIYMTTR